MSPASPIEGTFDDCQDLVKAMFADAGFREAVDLSGVNSINWARVAAQAVYYFTSAVALGAPQPAHQGFLHPHRQFRRRLRAEYVAMKMGLPIERMVIATNSNDIVARAFQTGRYERGQVMATQSPAMDIQVASNFERLYFEAAVGRDAAETKRAFEGFGQGGAVELPSQAFAELRKLFTGEAVDEPQTAATMAATLVETGELIDPHTAVAMAAAKRAGTMATPLVVLSTAHPAKFPEAVEAATGQGAGDPSPLEGPVRPPRTHRPPARRRRGREGLCAAVRGRMTNQTISPPLRSGGGGAQRRRGRSARPPHRLAGGPSPRFAGGEKDDEPARASPDNGVRVVCDPHAGAGERGPVGSGRRRVALGVRLPSPAGRTCSNTWCSRAPATGRPATSSR